MSEGDVVKHECEFCGYIGADVEYQPDPYAHDIDGDDTKYWICPKCLDQRCDDI